MDGLQDLTAQDLKDGFDDWYEKALQTGGFKTEEDKAAYIASIGL
jgi:endonuclease/exonuclease/phosphatase family metal-dependent hydrolase